MSDVALVVHSIQTGSQAESLGLRVGDVIRAVNGQAIESNRALGSALSGSGSRVLRVERRSGSGVQTLDFSLAPGPLGITCVGRELPESPSGQPGSNAVGRKIASILAVVGWLCVASGGVLILRGVAGASGVAEVASGFSVAVSGLVLVFCAHVGRAIFDGAEHTRAIRAHLERSAAE